MPNWLQSLNTAATSYPVTLAEAKANSRIDGTEEDGLISGYIAAATEMVEEASGRKLVTQTWDLKTYGLSGNQCVELPVSPVQSLSAISYQDNNDATQSGTASDYYVFVDQDRAWIEPKSNIQWPNTYDRPDAITLSVIAGYGTFNDVPETLRQAILLLVGHWEQSRAAVSEVKQYQVPKAFDALVGVEKVGWIAA